MIAHLQLNSELNCWIPNIARSHAFSNTEMISNIRAFSTLRKTFIEISCPFLPNVINIWWWQMLLYKAFSCWKYATDWTARLAYSAFTNTETREYNHSFLYYYQVLQRYPLTCNLDERFCRFSLIPVHAVSTGIRIYAYNMWISVDNETWHAPTHWHWHTHPETWRTTI